MTELGPDYGGPDYDAESRSLGRSRVRCGCGCGQDEFGGDRGVRTGFQGLVRLTEIRAIWDDEEEQ